MSNKQIEKVQIAFQFQVVGLTDAGSEDESDRAYAVYLKAYKLIHESYSKLSSATETFTEGGDTFSASAYQLCDEDGSIDEWNGKWVFGVWFDRAKEFTPAAVEELKRLCVEKFAEAAKDSDVKVEYAGARKYVESVVREWFDIEKA